MSFSACVKLAAKIKNFPLETATLSKAEAASRWISLLEEFYQIKHGSRKRFGNQQGVSLHFYVILLCLPPADSWPAISSALQDRAARATPLRAVSYRLLASVLDGNHSGVKHWLKHLRNLPESAFGGSFEQSQVIRAVENFSFHLTKDGDNQTAMIEAFEESQRLAYQKPNDFELTVPDLLRHFSKEEASPLILKSLLFKNSCTVEGINTRRLASGIAFENVDKLKSPPWDLIEEVSDLPLYEALARKFPRQRKYDHRREKADSTYLLLLIASERTADATAFLKNYPSTTPDSPPLSRPAEDDFLHQNDPGSKPPHISSYELGKRSETALGPKVLHFYKQLLASNPSLPLWRKYLEFSTYEKSPADKISFLRASLTKPGLPAPYKADLRTCLVSALLAADQTDAAVSEILALLAHKTTPAETSLSAGEKFNLVLQLCELGQLLQRPDLVEECLSAALPVLHAIPPQSFRFSGQLERLVVLQLKHGKAPQAESLLRGLLEKSRAPGSGASKSKKYEAKPLLTALCAVLSHQGKHGEVLKLLDEAAEWGENDLHDLREERFDDVSILFTTAKAFANAGRKPMASNCLQHLLRRYPSHDASYELLLSLGQSGTPEFLDHLAVDHRFEARPLIWKARLQLDSGDLEAAEKTIRRALALNPGNDDQAPGYRMHAHKLLGDILTRKGDLAGASTERNIVEAIRLAEQADELWQADLNTRAIALYEKAITRFPSDYCIQFNLALRLDEQGVFPKAENHYRRAFELMVPGIGPLDCHCHGCEDIFAGERAKFIADKVFAELSLKTPANPRFSYLIGRLRQQQQHHKEAAEAFRQAIKLDPDNFNTWDSLLKLDEILHFTPGERDSIRFNLYRLNPQAMGLDLAETSNLPQLWNTLLEAEKSHITSPARETLYPLAASAKVVASQDSLPEEPGIVSPWDDRPRDYLGQNEIIRQTYYLLQLLDEFEPSR